MLTRTKPLLRKPDPRARLEVPVLRKRKCKACGDKFQPARPLQAVCSPPCAISWGFKQNAREVEKQAKADRLADKAKREALKSRSQWLKEAQKEFNAYIRARDSARPCVSCGRFHEGQWHAGHFLSTGARPESRFDEDNVHRQCAPCNTHLSGNLVPYRAELLRRIGPDRLAALEGPSMARHYSIDELKTIKATYRAKTRALNAA